MADIAAELRQIAGPVSQIISGYPTEKRIDVGKLRAAADEIDRLRYVLDGVRGAIKTGRNEPLMIWKEQIDIALDNEPKK